MIKIRGILNLIAAMVVVGLTSCDIQDQEMADSSTASDLVYKVQRTDRLYTTQYVVHKVVAYDDVVKVKGSVLSQDFDITLPQGDRKVLIPIEAKIKAYIDFGKFSESNVTITDSTVTVTLPDPQVVMTSTRVDHSGIKSYVDFGRKKFTQAELSEFEQQGRKAILNSIPALGIIDDARADAYHLILPMVEAMGYKPEQITIEFRRDLSEADYLNDIVKKLLN